MRKILLSALLALAFALPAFAIDYYAASGDPATNSALSSSVIRAEYSAIALGFTKIAGYTGAGNRIPYNNSGGTAQTNSAGFTFDGTTFIAPALTVTNNAAVNGTALTTTSGTFTAFAGATTLLTIGGTGATSVFAIPGTLAATGTTGALTVAGGAYIAKALNVAGIITGTAAATPFKHTGTAATNTVVFQGSGYTTGGAYFQLGNTSGAFYAGVESSAGGAIITGSTAYDAAIAGSGLSFSANSGTTLHMRIASTGAVTIPGTLGVTGNTNIGGAMGIIAAATGTSLLTIGAATTSYSSLNIPHGDAPSSPVNGDIWTTTAGLYVHVNGSTVGPLN